MQTCKMNSGLNNLYQLGHYKQIISEIIKGISEKPYEAIVSRSDAISFAFNKFSNVVIIVNVVIQVHNV